MREPRNKIKEEVDTLKPVDISLFGSADDPCFGKLHDDAAEECQQCGDSEICSIICQQVKTQKRGVIESKNNFKDIDTEVNQNGIKPAQVERFIIKKIKATESGRLEYIKALKSVHSRYRMTKEEVKSMVSRITRQSTKIRRTIKNGKKYLRTRTL